MHLFPSWDYIMTVRNPIFSLRIQISTVYLFRMFGVKTKNVSQEAFKGQTIVDKVDCLTSLSKSIFLFLLTIL